MKRAPFLISTILALLGFWGCEPTPSQTSPAAVPSSTSIEEEKFSLPYTLALNSETLQGDTTVHLQKDVFFGLTKSYLAYSLQQTIGQTVAQLSDTVGVEVIFTCSDGYAPSMPLQTVLEHAGFVAYQDLDQTGQAWPDSLAAKFEPYYLVWANEQGPKAGFHWPYGLVSITFAKGEAAFADAIPMNEAVLPGYELFKNNCMKCHAINKVGGVLGPEFNHPRSITEYWSKEDIWAFAKSPQSFRYNSQMPPQAHLKREEFEAMYDYMVQMQQQKLIDPA